MIKSTFAAMTLAAILSTVTLSPARADVNVAFSGAPIPAASVANFFEDFAKAVIPSTGKASGAKEGKKGLFAAYNPQSGRAILLAGVGGTATFTATQSGKKGPCVGISGLAATNVGGGTETIKYYQLDLPGQKIPVSTSEANALFDATFGAGSRNGTSLTTLRSSSNGAVLARSWSGTQTVTWTTWYGTKVTAKMGIVRSIALVNGKLSAIFACGSGTVWGTYVQ